MNDHTQGLDDITGEPLIQRDDDKVRRTYTHHHSLF
jgi:hypothetical protein